MPPKSAAKTSAKTYDAPALRKGVGVIEVLCESDQPLGVTELCDRLDINKHMMFRILQTLLDINWVVFEPATAKYSMSLRPFHFTSKPVNRTDLLGAAMLPAKALWDEIGENLSIAVLDGDQFMYISHLQSRRQVSLTGSVGGRYYLHASAPGKLFLAYGSEALWKTVTAATLPALTGITITTKRELQQEIKDVRAQGYALDMEEYADGAMCFAAPIFNCNNEIVGALNCSVVTFYYTPEQFINTLGPKVLAVAETISRALGCGKSFEPQPN